MEQVKDLPYRRRRRRVPLLVAVLGVYMLVALLGTVIAHLDLGNTHGYDIEQHALVKRAIEESEGAPILNCTPQGVNHFPEDLFTLEQRQQGAVVVHVVAALYIFAAIAIVCDDYFVPSLEALCEALKIQPDVAGATFMAAGSSAPELFTAIIGLFLAQSDVGVASIVGSAVFNILAIVAVCGLFAGSVIPLTWWPVFRDSVYYMLSIGALTVIMADEKVHWYEALVLLIMYIIYIIIMYFNPRLGTFAITTVAKWRGKPPDENNVHTPLLEERAVSNEDQIENGYLKTNETILWEKEQESNKTISEKRLVESDIKQAKDDYQSALSPPSGCLKNTTWVLMLPANLLFFLSIPDCRRSGCWKKLYLLTFTMSILWIAGLSYIMVWMVSVIGDTLNIPDTVMGLTLLAAGTSVPDMLASLFVARDGYGDMAISNSIGSNVFDILLCLGLPWLIQTAIVEPNSIVVISSSGMEVTSIGLLGTVLFLLIALSVTGWKLNKLFGFVCFLAYVVVITLSCLYELNVFGQFNPPPCPR